MLRVRLPSAVAPRGSAALSSSPLISELLYDFEFRVSDLYRQRVVGLRCLPFSRIVSNSSRRCPELVKVTAVPSVSFCDVPGTC